MKYAELYVPADGSRDIHKNINNYPPAKPSASSRKKNSAILANTTPAHFSDEDRLDQ
jgi:hypothetical protein